MNESAVKRLEAIREFTELGSGIRIAMRDLEVRGAGSLLGAEQHGQMNEIGYELYSRMLDEEIRALKEGGDIIRTDEEEQTAKVEIECNAYIPASYIPDETGRMAAYRRIADIRDTKGLSDLTDELSDRYGDPVPEIHLLAGVSYIRHAGSVCGYRRIVFKGSDVRFYYRDPGSIDMEAIAKVMSTKDIAARVRIVTTADTYLSYQASDPSPFESVREAVRLVSVMAPARIPDQKSGGS